MSTEQKTSKIVNIEEFYLNHDYKIILYTADWCNPCKRIKPFVMAYTKEKIREEKIDQKSYQEKYNKYVPYFVILKNSEIVDKIQTSNENEFTEFIKKYINIPILDENF